MTRSLVLWATVLVLVSGQITASAGIDSGNDLARNMAYAKNKGIEKELQKTSAGNLYFFRYLKIVDLVKDSTNGPAKAIQMKTIEPSSDMYVTFVVRKPESLKLADPLLEGDAVAVTGRVKSINKDTHLIELDPVIVRYKDRLDPKVGKELLCEVDKTARYGTDTSSGEEKIIKK